MVGEYEEGFLYCRSPILEQSLQKDPPGFLFGHF